MDYHRDPLGVAIMRRICRCDSGVGDDGLCDCARFVVDAVKNLERQKEQAEDELAWIYNVVLDHTAPIRKAPSKDASRLEDLLAREGADKVELEARIEKLELAKKQVADLMAESRGVDGLHLNGDLAEWDWLVENQWLSEWHIED